MSHSISQKTNETPIHRSMREVITRFLFLENAPQPVDVVVVLGSDWLPTVDLAVARFKQGLTPKLLMTGAISARTQEATSAQEVASRQEEAIHQVATISRHETISTSTHCERFCAYALSQGVPESALLREERATNILEQVRFSGHVIAEQLGWNNVRNVAVVCPTFQARGVLLTATKLWPEHVQCLCWPIVDERNIRRDNWWIEASARQCVLDEVQQTTFSMLKDDVPA